VVELFTQETRAAEEKMKDANWEFTKEVCIALGSISAPSLQLQELANKFMSLIGQKECSWPLFKAPPSWPPPLRD
jgi:hypothetical protein